MNRPTAQTSLGETATTALKSPSLATMLGITVQEHVLAFAGVPAARAPVSAATVMTTCMTDRIRRL